ncbi:MAG: glycosyltransferase [Chitinophagaceae bacterium]|nr:glycosyltransferase [Chitinophagaceae bacterium]
MNYHISICIPAYKRIDYLKRLLSSIEIQNFKNYEVIISDDSNDNSVEELLKDFKGKFEIKYFKNEKALGTPANWNHAISKATGQWIKLMHDDDWFSNEHSLEKFVSATKNGHPFIFSAYSNKVELTNNTEMMFFNEKLKTSILKNPLLLLAKNIIGPPSVTLFHNSIKDKYDERLKWRVDIEYYISNISKGVDFAYINEPLINVGVSESQVTNSCLNVPSVEIPEMYILLTKYGTSPLKNIMVYDAYWRILRNTHINSKHKLESFGQTEWPEVILSMIELQSKFNQAILRNGVLSKTLMSISYIYNLSKSNL